MRATRLVVGVSLVVAAAGVASAAPHIAWRSVSPGSNSAQLIAGELTLASTRSPSAIAMAYVATSPEPLTGSDVSAMAITSERFLGGGARGSIVELRQFHRGLDVIGSAIAVRIDTRGVVRWLAASHRDVPGALDVTPSIDARAAIAAAVAGRNRASSGLDPARHARLVVWALAGPPRLAWQVVLPRDVRTLETLRVHVDATTGDLIHIENLARTDRRANVFAENPVTTPTTSEVILSDLAVGATQLDSADIVGRTCVDNHTCAPIDFGGGARNIHFCELVPLAVADSEGDFLYTRPTSDLDPEDAFAEVQLVHHAHVGLTRFRELGLVDLASRPMEVVANFRMPPFDGSEVCTGTTHAGPLESFDNAMFSPAGSFGGFSTGDLLLFGQGTFADLAYDGDVVYHELGHAVMSTLTTMGWAVPDTLGLDTTPGGMQEGYADYWSAVFTDDPGMGEYAGSTFTGVPGPIRRLDNTKTCPEDLTGESHDDSEPFSATLWTARAALPVAARAGYDQAVFDAISTATETDTMLTVAARTLAEIETTLGTAARAQVETAFAARGFDDCNSRVIDTAVTPETPILWLAGRDQFPADRVPGPVQWKHTLAEPAQSVEVDIDAGYFYYLGTLRLLVKPGDEPIRWNWAGAAVTHDVTHTREFRIPEDGSSFTMTVRGPFPAGPVHVQLANEGGTAIVEGIRLRSTPAPEPPEEETSGGGCVASHASGGLWLMALIVGALILRRRF